MKQNRARSLDALRGYAIMTMILSGTITFGILPGWMYHAQVPPPMHIFNPSIYGITWVDLVFPFFLFSMGAAFPLSIGRSYAKGVSKARLCYKSVLRGLKLTFFAIYVQHIFPFVLGYSNQKLTYLVAFGGFALMFLMFMKNPFKISDRWAVLINAGAYILGALWIYFQPYQGGRPFTLYDNDIIILILANVAVFGSVIYIFTMQNRWARWAVLPFLLAIFLSSGTQQSWAKVIVDFSPFAWMYKFVFLKYLFIIIPGTVAGELLIDWLNNSDKITTVDKKKKERAPIILLLSFSLIICNVCCLYGRYLVLNLIISAVIITILHFLLKSNDRDMIFWRKLYANGVYLLILGLCFEAFQGGIRKDDVTYSYLLVTSGLAFMALMVFSIISDYYHCKCVSTPLEMVGKNPMIAYVSPLLVILPLLGLAGIYDYLSYLDHNVWLGFLRGVIQTALCMLVTMLFTKIKWFWRT